MSDSPNVILVNRTKRPPRMLVLNLTKKIAPVKVTNRTTDETRDGLRSKRISTKFVPDSIRIPAGGELEVKRAILGCPDVAAAKARREIRVKPAPSEAEKKTAAAKLKAAKAAAKAYAEAKKKSASVVGQPKTRQKKRGGEGGGEA